MTTAPPVQTAAAVLIYHAIAFWIPSLGGLIGYALLRRRESPQTRQRAAAAGEIRPTVTPQAKATLT